MSIYQKQIPIENTSTKQTMLISPKQMDLPPKTNQPPKGVPTNDLDLFALWICFWLLCNTVKLHAWCFAFYGFTHLCNKWLSGVSAVCIRYRSSCHLNQFSFQRLQFVSLVIDLFSDVRFLLWAVAIEREPERERERLWFQKNWIPLSEMEMPREELFIGVYAIIVWHVCLGKA